MGFLTITYDNLIARDFKHGTALLLGVFNRIEDNVQVGDNVTIRNYVELREGTRIGNGCYIDSRVSTSGGDTCRIGNNVTIRYGSIIARNVIIEDDVFISPQVGFINIPFTNKEKKNTVIGEGTKIGFNATIHDGVTIAKGTIIGAKANVIKDILTPGIYVGNPARLLTPKDPRIKIGKNVIVEPGSVIGAQPYAFNKRTLITPEYGVDIKDDVWIGTHCIVMRGLSRDTHIGKGVKIAQYCNIGHDSIIADRVMISAGTMIGGYAEIGRRTILGMQVTVRNRVKIGACSMIGEHSNVVKDIPDNVVAFGNPCRVQRERFNTINYFIRRLL